MTSLFAIDHLCRTDGPTYTASPDKENGFAGDRFWFDGANNFCMSTAVGTASGWWGHGSVCKGTGVRQVKLSVAFSADQSGCQPLKMWNIPKSQECTDIFSKLVDDCKLSNSRDDDSENELIANRRYRHANKQERGNFQAEYAKWMRRLADMGYFCLNRHLTHSVSHFFLQNAWKSALEISGR